MSDDTRCDKAEKMRAVSRERAKLRAEYDAAEYRLIAAIAARKAAMCAVDYRDLNDDELTALAAASASVCSCRVDVQRAREACEAAAVIVNPHMALVYL